MSRLQDLINELCPDGVEFRTLGELAEITRGDVISKRYIEDNQGPFPVYSSQTLNNGIFGYIKTYKYDFESVTWTTDGANAGSVFYHKGERFSITNVCGLIRFTEAKALPRFYYHFLSSTLKTYVSAGMGNAKLMSNVVREIAVPLPPLEVQSEIVRILDAFTELTAELTDRKKQYEYYRDKLLTFKAKKHF